MRHFLRIDGGVAVGPSLAAVVFVKTGETLHLNEDDPDEGKVAESVAAASSGWVEVDEAGIAIPRRTVSVVAEAEPAVESTTAGDPIPDVSDAQDSSGDEPPAQVIET